MDNKKRTSEWTRCFEGFSDMKNFGKGTDNNNRRVRRNKPVDIGRNRAKETVQREPDNPAGQDILCSSIGSDDDTVSEIHLGKRKKITKRSSPSKKKSLQREYCLICHVIPPIIHPISRLDKHSQVVLSSETVDIVASDSESENTSQQLSKNSGSIKTQEGSIQGYESASDEENNHNTKDEDLSQTVKTADMTDSPSISGSTQSVSPPPTNTGSGVKASDWVKSLQLKTPSKSENQRETITAEDSAKKKKKHNRGGLAEQLSRLLAREKSSVRMWSHQQNKTPTSSQDTSKAVTLRVLGFEVLYSVQVVKCAVLSGGEEGEHKLVMIPVNQSEVLNLQVGTEVTVSPPWQQLEMNDGQSIMLCTRFCQVTFQPDDVKGENSASDLSEGKKDVVTATWNCPCVQGLCKFSSMCPAYKFPSVPGLIVHKSTSAASTEGSSKVISPEKHLHTVTKKAKEDQNVSDSLLESIERSSENASKMAAGSSVNFRGTVHRVNTICTEKENRYLLLVEDSHGAVCEIQVSADTLKATGQRPDSMEGKSLQFSGLNVTCRKTRDKDPSLFSMIDSVWSGKRETVDSQDSENSTNGNKQGILSEPPSFCYILTFEENDANAITPSTASVIQTKPAVFRKLEEIVTEPDTRRCSCIGRILYVHFPTETNPSQSGPTVYITDRNLQKSQQPYIKCHFIAASRNFSKFKDCKNHILKLRDAFVEKGELSADTYTKAVLEPAEENSSEEVIILNKIDLPELNKDSKKTDLCLVTGVIGEVDEDSAYSWEACNFCGSDQLVSQPTESGDNASSVICRNCQKPVTTPDVKLKMEIMLKCNHMSNTTVRVDLLQSTVERLLPSDEGGDEGYELSAVLNKPVGPLNCVVIDSTEESRQKYLSLREIELLL